MTTIQTQQFEFVPFSQKQLSVLDWWLDPEVFNHDYNLNELSKEHSPLLNRTDYESIICDGSIRAGKTLIMSMSYIMWSMTNYSEEQFGIAGKTIGSLRRNLVKPLKRMLVSRGYHVRDMRADNELVITFGNNTNYYYLFGGKDEGSQDLVQGITTAGFFFDEVALMPESFVNQATARASVDGSKLWFNCNPGGPFHWFKLDWLDDLTRHRAMHIHFMMDDNPSLSDAKKESYRRQYKGVFYERYILGKWVLADGVIYSNFDEKTMVVDPPSNITKYYVSCDYGTKNPTVFLLWGFSNGTWYALKEYYYDGRHSTAQKTDNQYADDLDRFLGNIKCSIIVDPSAASFITLLRRRGHTVIKADNDVLDGIRETQTAMNLGEIKFTRNCKNLFKEFSSYIWDAKAAERGEDKPLKQHDHGCDATRYFVYKVVRKPSQQAGIQMMTHL